MTGTGMGRRVRALRRCAVLALAALPAWAAAADWDLARLMQTLALNRSGRATFVERKFMALLDKPLESSGELRFVAPNRLEKRTLRPRAESLVLDDGTLTMERAGQTRSLALRDYPEVAAFVDSIRGTLAGDREALERAYALALEGDATRWTLTLTPLAQRMRAVVDKIRIRGARGTVTEVEILQADGDYSLMRIDKATAP